MGPEKMVHFHRLLSGTKISFVGAFKLGVFQKLVWYINIKQCEFILEAGMHT
jgi:hypothetical protein